MSSLNIASLRKREVGRRHELNPTSGVGMSGTLVPMGTGVPAGTHRNLENLGTAGYRVPGKFKKMGTAGYRVPGKF